MKPTKEELETFTHEIALFVRNGMVSVVGI